MTVGLPAHLSLSFVTRDEERLIRIICRTAVQIDSNAATSSLQPSTENSLEGNTFR
jgi:hypothetical protein